MKTPFETLIEEFPVYVVKNKVPVSKNIPLKDNEELVVPAHGTVKINSYLLTGIPSSTYFKSISPSVKDLIRLGLIETVLKPAVPVTDPEPEDKWGDKKKK